jgi:KDO2-lipid IV(A) lauroyltransferase
MNALKVALARALLHFCSLIPLAVARGLGRGGARLYWLLGGRARQVTARNIDLAFPDMAAAHRKELARCSLQATGELLAETGRIWLRPWPEVSTLIQEVHGAGLIADAQAAGRGVVVLVPHLGNWEILGLHLATLGNTVSLYEPPKLVGLDALIRRGRQASGATLVPTNAAGLAGLYRNLRAGGIAGILPDQVPGKASGGENASFMGVPCFTPTLAGNLVRRSGALAVFGFAQRVPGGFALRYIAAEDALYDEDTTVSLAALNLGVETCLKQCPAQYQWEYKRFRARPKQGPGHYHDLD